MRAQKALVRGQLAGQFVHAAGAFQHGAVHQMEQQGTAQHFTVEQLVQIDAGDAGLAAQDQAALVGAAALGDHRIRQTEKAVLPDGLELVEVGTHHIGFHCKLGGRSEKDDFDDVIVLPDLLGGGNAVFGRHMTSRNRISYRVPFSISASRSSGL